METELSSVLPPRNEEQQEPQDDRSYFQRRVFDEMGLTPEQNKIELRFDTGVNGRSGKCTFDIFSEDKDGNINILVYTLRGWTVQYPNPNMGKTYDHSNVERLKYYYVTRKALENIQSEDEGKYYDDTCAEREFPEVWAEAVKKVHEYFLYIEDGEVPFVVHNKAFDENCLKAVFRAYDIAYPDYEFECTLLKSRKIWPEGHHNLDIIAGYCGYDLENHHHALADAEACAWIAREIL